MNETPSLPGSAKRARRPAPASERAQYVGPTEIPKSHETRHPEKKVEINVPAAQEMPSVAHVAQEVQAHFFNDQALASYVSYLEGELGKNGFDPERAQLPSGEKFSEINWNRGEVDGLLERLKGRLEEHERLTSLRSIIHGRVGNDNGNAEAADKLKKTQETSKHEELQQQLERLIEKEDDLKAKIAKLEPQGFGARFAKMFTRSTEEKAQIARLRQDLQELEAQQNLVEEDIAMLTYENAIQKTKGRPRGIPMTPTRVTESEAAERQRTEDRVEATRRRGKTQKTARQLEEEIAGPAAEEAPVEVSGEIEIPQAERNKILARMDKEDQEKELTKLEAGWDEDAADHVIAPPKEVLRASEEAAKVNERRMKPMTVDRAAELVPNASALWEYAYAQMKQHPMAEKDAQVAEEFKGKASERNLPTAYVYAIAKYHESLQNNDGVYANAMWDRITKYNQALGIDTNNAQFLAAFAPKPEMSAARRVPNTVRSRAQRQERRMRF